MTSKKDIKDMQSLVHPNLVKYFFIILMLAVLGLFFYVISPFLYLLIYAALLAVFFNGIHERVRNFVSNVKSRKPRFLKIMNVRGTAALISTSGISLLFLISLVFFVTFLAQEGVSAIQSINARINEEGFTLTDLNFARIEEIPFVGQGLLEWSEQLGVEGLVSRVEIDAFQLFQDIGQTVSTFLVNQSGAIFVGLGNTAVDVFIFLLALFFFFRDGDQILAFIKRLSPLPKNHEAELLHKLKKSIHGVIMGNFGTSLVQGVIAGFGFLFVGIPNFFFWTAVMSFASLIPYVGAAIIWFPASLILMASGSLAKGIFLFLWGMFVVSTSDNVVRPKLIAGSSDMHPLATFLVVIGGILLLGIKGIIIGPLILSLTISVLHIYELEYKDVLKF